MKNQKVVIIGLGHFGSRLAMELTDIGHEVLVMDKEKAKISEIGDVISNSVIVDTTDLEQLKSIGIADYDIAVVAIRSRFQDSLVTTANLQSLGMNKIYVRVINSAHEQILGQMQIENVIFPEVESAKRFAMDLKNSRINNYMKVSKDFGIHQVDAPKWIIGHDFRSLEIRERFNINVMACFYQDSENSNSPCKELKIDQLVGAETKVETAAKLIIFGKTSDIEIFTNYGES